MLRSDPGRALDDLVAKEQRGSSRPNPPEAPSGSEGMTAAEVEPVSLERAAAQYELVLHHVPDHLPAMTGLAAELCDQGELSQARRLYEQVLAVASRDLHALAGLAGVLHDLGDTAGAEQRFQQRGRPPLAQRPRRLTH